MVALPQQFGAVGLQDGYDEPPQPYPSAETMDYRIDLSPEERGRLGRRICEEIRRYRQAVQPRLDCCSEWRRSYEMAPTGRAQRWLDSADVPSAMTRIYCQAATTRLNQQIVQAKPPMSVVARTPRAIDAAPYIEDAMGYQLEQADWPVAADEVHTELPQVGNTFIRVQYEREVRHVPTQHVSVNEGMMAGHLAAGADPNEAPWDSLETNAQGQVKQRIVYEDRMLYCGVRFKVIPFEDGIIMPPTVRDSRDAYGIGEQLTIRGEELRAGVKDGRYLEDEVSRLLRGRSDDPNFSMDGSSRRQDRLYDQGVQADAGGAFSNAEYGDDADALYREYQCYRLCWLGDWNKNNKLVWALVHIHEPTEQLLGIQYLPYEHGEPCYTMMGMLPRPGELFSAGLAEVVATYQDADTAVLCQLIDHNDLALNWNGNLLLTKSAGYDPDKAVAALGRPMIVNDINGVQVVPPYPLPAEAYQLHQMFKDSMDLVTASSNPSLGQVTDTNKTLGEVQIVAASANMMFEEMASRVARQWARVWDQVRWLVAQYGDGTSDGLQVTYRKAAIPGRKITAEDGTETPAAMVGGQEMPAPSGFAFQPIPAEMLREDVDLVPTGLQLLSDMQSRLGQATQVMGVLRENPLTATNVEVQKIALDTYLQAFHYPKHEKVMGEIEQALAAQAQAQAQQQQAQSAVMEAALHGAAGTNPLQTPQASPLGPAPGPGAAAGAPPVGAPVG